MGDILMMRLSNDLDYRETGNSENLFGGAASYVVEDAFFDDDSLVKITVTAGYGDVTKTITTYTQKPTNGWVPPFIRGAWTANSNLNNTISDMYIDGRDHDLDLNLIPTTGRYGVSTSTAFVNTDNAEIGGTNTFVDYPMTFPEVAEVIEENYEWDGGFPETPDAILGYPEGTLKAAAQTGEHGSQYILVPSGTNDIDGGLLTYPLSGVTYIEMQNAAEAELFIEQNGNSGILVINGEDGSSRIKGIKYDSGNSDGLFTGLLVGDYTFHHHLNILGSVLLLSPDLEDSKNCNGNKDHWVKYSSEAITNATQMVSEISGLSGDVGYGFGKKRLNVKSVYE